MFAAIDPTEAVAQANRDAVRLSLSKCQPWSAAATADQERHASRRRKMPLALFGVARQRLDRAGMDRQLVGLCELGLRDGSSFSVILEVRYR